MVRGSSLQLKSKNLLIYLIFLNIYLLSSDSRSGFLPKALNSSMLELVMLYGGYRLRLFHSLPGPHIYFQMKHYEKIRAWNKTCMKLSNFELLSKEVKTFLTLFIVSKFATALLKTLILIKRQIWLIQGK